MMNNQFTTYFAPIMTKCISHDERQPNPGLTQFFRLLRVLSWNGDVVVEASPVGPRLLVFTHANPLKDNPVFLQEMKRLADSVAAGRRLPPFLPLGTLRYGGNCNQCVVGAVGMDMT